MRQQIKLIILLTAGDPMSDDCWPEPLAKLPEEEPAASEHVVVAEICEPWGDVGARLQEKTVHNRHSKKKLWKPSKQYFDGITLFDELARTVCDAECLPRKELYESWELATRVRRRLRGRRIVDLACGHGLVAHVCSLLDPGYEEAVAVDQGIPKNARHLSNVLTARWRRLQVAYVECPLQEFELQKHDVVVSAHACGALTDVVIERAIAVGASLAVLPCCHQKTEPTGLEGWMAPDVALDVMRAQRLTEAGYKVHTNQIPHEITPKNRVLVAKPRIS